MELSRVPSHRQAGHNELAERLVECQYELTDRLAFYLCGRKPGEQSSRRACQAGGPRHTSASGTVVTPLLGKELLGNRLL